MNKRKTIVEGKEVEALPALAVKRTLEKLGAVEIDSGKYNVIIDGRQMSSILSAFSPVSSSYFLVRSSEK